MRSPWIICVGPKFNCKGHCKSQMHRQETHQGEGSVKMKTEMEWHGQPRKLKKADSHQKLEEGRNGFSSRAPRGSTTWPDLDRGFQMCERVNFCYFKPGVCGYFLQQPQETDTVNNVLLWDNYTGNTFWETIGTDLLEPAQADLQKLILEYSRISQTGC